MDKDCFLEKCGLIGVDSIVKIDNDYDEGFKVVFKDKSAIYVLFRDEYGDSWMEYETEEHFIERWKNTHILTDEELLEYNKKTLKSLKDKYSNKNFGMFMDLFNEQKK